MVISELIASPVFSMDDRGEIPHNERTFRIHQQYLTRLLRRVRYHSYSDTVKKGDKSFSSDEVASVVVVTVMTPSAFDEHWG